MNRTDRLFALLLVIHSISKITAQNPVGLWIITFYPTGVFYQRT